ncbi:hypothetical protein BWQ96_03269 [Gracilariopsis chorda]|uniref:Uncharacterized protein n=1 Tax=Gracilariopsis chorda TaxID=448386 RepID=A0A2V3IXT9_9FLOR|nr:hypothetical protein BWQ96_03269 [Gracilariopsis chorda]|eukprot:PXF46931.1 hypothetical protein BWQ96_03269 [Gracilariopsis chorda]
MDVVIRKSLSQPAILDVTEKNGILTMICEENSGTALFYAEQTNGIWEKHRLSIADQAVAGQKFGAFVKVGSRDRFVYLASKDAGTVCVFSGSELSGSYTLRKTVKDVFVSPILGLWILKNNRKRTQHQCFLLAISQTGEILLIDENNDKLPIRIEKALSLSLDRVLKVSQIRDDSVALIGQKDGNHQLCMVRFGSLETLESIELFHSSPLSLFEDSRIPANHSNGRRTEVMDFALKRHCLCVLFQGGYVCFFKAQRADSHSPAMTGMDFFSLPYQQDPKAAPLSVCFAHAVTLHSSLDADEMSDEDFENSGFVDNVEENFFTVGYGKYVSIWDSEYLVLHKYVQADSAIRKRSSGISTSGRFFVTEEGVQEVITPPKKSSGRVSLGMAMKRKEECSALLQDIHQTMEKSAFTFPTTVNCPNQSCGGC